MTNLVVSDISFEGVLFELTDSFTLAFDVRIKNVEAVGDGSKLFRFAATSLGLIYRLSIEDCTGILISVLNSDLSITGFEIRNLTGGDRSLIEVNQFSNFNLTGGAF